MRRPSHTSERKCEYGANSSDNSDNPSAGSGSRVAVQQELGLCTERRLGVAGRNCDYSPSAARVLTQDASP